MYANTEDYIITICLIWMIMTGFFIILTTEIMLLIGLAFPILIILLLKDKQIIDSRIARKWFIPDIDRNSILAKALFWSVDAISYSDPGRMIRQDQKHYCLFVLLQIHEGYPFQIAIQLCWVKYLNRVPGTDALCISKMYVVYTLPLKLMQDLDYEYPVHCTSSH